MPEVMTMLDGMTGGLIALAVGLGVTVPVTMFYHAVRP